MAGAILINGIDIGRYVAHPGVRRSEEEVGERTRAFSGSARSAVRARKLMLDGRTTPGTQADMAALRGLLQGDGALWTFDTDLYSNSKGHTPTTSGTTTAGNAGGLFGSNKHLNTAGYAEWDVGAGAAWTIAGIGLCTSFSWERFILTSAGGMWRGGVSQATTLAMWNSGKALVTVTGTKVRAQARRDDAGTWAAGTPYSLGAFLKGGGSGAAFWECTQAGTSGGAPPAWDEGTGTVTIDNTVRWTARGAWRGLVDDLWFLPALAPSSWISQIDAELAARVLTAQPRLRVTGTLIENAPRTMRGRIGTGELPRAASGFRDAFEFTLEED
jgi:hypothetical protein